MNSFLKLSVLILGLVSANTSFAQTTFSCAANCGSATSYHEVTSEGATLAKAYSALVLRCNESLFVQASLASNGNFNYTLASLQNACISQSSFGTCTCAANCGSAAGYREMTTSGSTGAKAFTALVSSCRTSLLFTQATPRNDGDFDYTFAGLQNACVCQ